MGVRSLAGALVGDKRSEAPSTCSTMIHIQFHVNLECNMIYDGCPFLEFHTDILIACIETRIHFNRKSLRMTYPSVSRSDMAKSDVTYLLCTTIENLLKFEGCK